MKVVKNRRNFQYNFLSDRACRPEKRNRKKKEGDLSILRGENESRREDGGI